jgi:hypothetical protein
LELIGGNTLVNSVKVSDLQEDSLVPGILVQDYSEHIFPIRNPKNEITKTYNFYFCGGVLNCTFDQLVLCKYKKILPIGQAIISQTKIHTASGLLLPTFIENSNSKTDAFYIKPRGHNYEKAVVIESVYCL